MKVTTKLAKNDARLYYVDSKRVSRDKALESAAQNRVGNPFVVEYDTEQNHYLIQGGIEKHIYTDRRTFDKLNIRIDNYHGFTVYCGTCQLRTFVCNFGAKNFAAQIEDAFINGEHGIKITVDGKISILPNLDDYAVTVEAQDSAVDAEIQNAKFAQYLRDEAQREHEFELLAAFGKQAPEFKRYGSFKPKAAHIDATLEAKTFKPANVAESEDDEYVPATPDTVKNSDEAWALLQKRFTGEFKFSAKFTPPDGITTATYYNREANLRLDVTSVDGEEFYFALCEIDNQPFVVGAIEVDPTLNTDAPEVKTTAPEIDEDDDFTSRMAKLTADLKEANDACTEACNFREMKRKEFDNACEAAEDAEILVRRKRKAIAEFGQTCAKDLSKKLIDDTLIFSPTMKVTNQAGGICKTDFEQIQIFFRDSNLTFYISTDWIFLGEYETPAQVEAVILELKAAIKRGDEEFSFPTVEDLSEPVHISEALAELPVIQKILAQRSLTA